MLGKTTVGIFIRNFFNYKPVHMNIDGLRLMSVSDAFAWRTDNNFKTIFKYSDILNIFYKIKNSWIEFHFYDKNNNRISWDDAVRIFSPYFVIKNEIISTN
jgi:hypothetical protein